MVIRDYFDKGAEMKGIKDASQTMQADGGSVKGYASTFDREPDAYGDVIAKGAFIKSLKRWEELGKPIPLLYGHNTDDPEYNIGKVTEIYEDEKGLYVEAEFDAENEKAQYVRKLVQEGRLFQFSFAFECTDWAEVELADGTKANELRELDIFEVSLVQIPANQHAEVVEVKNTVTATACAPVDACITASVPEIKSGRRNSKADEEQLRRIVDIAINMQGDVAEACAEIQSIINGLMPDEEQSDETNAEEPQANADESKQALIDEATAILETKE